MALLTLNRWLFLLLIPFAYIGVHAQTSGGVIKAGLVWNDIIRDDKSITKASQAGHAVGLEVRLGAEDITYFKLGSYYTKMHIQTQEHAQGTKFFNISNGFGLLKGIVGVETRLITRKNFNWRLAATGAFNLVANVVGTTKFEDLNSAYFGIHFSTGIDISYLSIDLGLEPGFGDFRKNLENTKPFMMMLTMGFHF